MGTLAAGTVGSSARTGLSFTTKVSRRGLRGLPPPGLGGNGDRWLCCSCAASRVASRTISSSPAPLRGLQRPFVPPGGGSSSSSSSRLSEGDRMLKSSFSSVMNWTSRSSIIAPGQRAAPEPMGDLGVSRVTPYPPTPLNVPITGTAPAGDCASTGYNGALWPWGQHGAARGGGAETHSWGAALHPTAPQPVPRGSSLTP